MKAKSENGEDTRIIMKERLTDIKNVSALMDTHTGRNDRIRTCDIVLPNKSVPIFSLISGAFRGFWVQKRCFRVLLFALFPRSPKP